jgi:hypothetical protein
MIRSAAADFARHGERSWVFDVNAQAMNGYIDALDGDAEGVIRIRRAIDALGASSPAPGAISTLTRVLVGAHEMVGDPSEGRAAAEHALRLDGTRLWEAEIRRLHAVFMFRTGATRSEVHSELIRASGLAESRMQAGPARALARTRADLLAAASD